MRIFSTCIYIYSIVRLEKYVQNRKFNGNVSKGAKGVRRSFYAKTSKFGHSQFNFDLRLYDMKRLSMDSRNHPIFSLIFVQATMALHIFLELWINGHLMVFECNSQLVPLSWSMWSKRDSFPVLSFSIFFFFPFDFVTYRNDRIFSTQINEANIQHWWTQRTALTYGNKYSPPFA